MHPKSCPLQAAMPAAVRPTPAAAETANVIQPTVRVVRADQPSGPRGLAGSVFGSARGTGGAVGGGATDSVRAGSGGAGTSVGPSASVPAPSVWLTSPGGVSPGGVSP